MGWFRGRKETKLETKKQARVRERDPAVLTPSRGAARGVGSTNEIFTKTLLLPKLQTHPPPHPPTPGPGTSDFLLSFPFSFIQQIFIEYPRCVGVCMGLGVQWGNVPVSDFKLEAPLECPSVLPRVQVYRAGVAGDRMPGAALCVGEVAAERGNRTMPRASENKRCLSLLKGEDQKLPVWRLMCCWQDGIRAWGKSC